MEGSAAGCSVEVNGGLVEEEVVEDGSLLKEMMEVTVGDVVVLKMEDWRSKGDQERGCRVVRMKSEVEEWSRS